jgi:hypothetical protein
MEAAISDLRCSSNFFGNSESQRMSFRNFADQNVLLSPSIHRSRHKSLPHERVLKALEN